MSAKLKSLTRETILNCDDLKKEVVPVPEWGGTVTVTTMTGFQRDAFEQSIIETKGKSVTTNMENIRSKLCAHTIVDEDGKRLFSDADIRDLGGKSAAALDRIFAVAQRLNGLRDEDVEGLAKN